MMQGGKSLLFRGTLGLGSEGSLLGSQLFRIDNDELNPLLWHPLLWKDANCDISNDYFIVASSEGLVQHVVKATHSAHSLNCVDLLVLNGLDRDDLQIRLELAG
jgi:hypothetical protein